MLIPTEPIWIDQDALLADLCHRWRQQAAIAVDTEFMRTDTFYPIAGLIQIGDGKGCYLIDPLAISDFEPLRQLLLDPSVTKVLHACSEDLEVFQRLLGLVPAPLFDTQIAAAFAGYGFSLGYAGLVKAALATEIPKAETRSDWLARPLSAAQLKYAALDVAHMLVVYGKLLQNLKASGRLDWVKADCAELVANARRPDDFSRAYEKVGLAWKLRSRELLVLKNLCIWRELEARDLDVPRNRLAKETALWEMARKQPRDKDQLQKIPDLPSRSLRDHADELLDIIAESAAAPESDWPERLPFPLAAEEGPLLKQLKNTARHIAEAMDVPVEVLVRKKDYEALVRSARRGDVELPERLNGWRKPLLGEPLLAAAREHLRLHPSGTAATPQFSASQPPE